MRGRRKSTRYNRYCRRSIPARAGETESIPLFHSPCRVNPRACGGDFWFERDLIAEWGQSPRVRGRPIAAEKIAERHNQVIFSRRVAAYAYSTARLDVCMKFVDSFLVHHCYLLPFESNVVNNSQKIKSSSQEEIINTPFARKRNPRAGRSIPARAGETFTGSDSPTAVWVNPRACGGDPFPTGPLDPFCGQSPRVRGRHLCDNRRASRNRSIPARAGETQR